MSVLTRVFVVLLTVFSIFLSAFVIAAFAQQDKWKQSAEDWRQQALAETTRARTLASNLAIEQQLALDRQNELTRGLNEQKAITGRKSAELSDVQAQLAECRNQLDVEQAQVNTVGRNLELVQTAFNSEQEHNAKLLRQNSELTRGNIDLNDRVTELTTQLLMAQSRVKALKEQIAMMDAAPAGEPAQIPSAAGTVQPYTPTVAAPTAAPAPIAPIRAEVTEVDGDVASISVGSADGVVHGMEFLLYRAGDDGSRPNYLGTLKIERVEANRSAGRLIQREGEIRPGDSARDVASFAMRG